MTEVEAGLERVLSSWQQAMIAIGGIIGVGLFLGSGTTIGLAGPAVVVTYLIAAVVPVALGLALAEMAPVHAEPGSFGIYADAYIGAWAGFLTRLSYWFAEILAVGAMASAIGVYFAYWFPDAPSFVFMVLAALVAVGVNALDVGRFASVDAALSWIKVIAIAAFIVVGGALVLRSGAGGSHLVAHGGFFPRGVSGIWLSLTLVITSFLGLEAVAVTAGEARNPNETVPRALFFVVSGLILLYVLAMLVIVAVGPWTSMAETDGTLTGSPFVTVFRDAGVPYAGGVMNVVVISAALTALVSHLYLSSRMLYSLACAGYAPRALARLDRSGVPRRALMGSSLGMGLAIVFAVFGTQVFLPMYGTGVAALMSIWTLVLLCHARFRKERGKPFPMLSLVGGALIVIALAATPWVAGLSWTLPLFGAWLAAIGAFYRFTR